MVEPGNFQVVVAAEEDQQIVILAVGMEVLVVKAVTELLSSFKCSG